jgi:outer membrane receptor protein involved in Fe transport
MSWLRSITGTKLTMPSAFGSFAVNFNTHGLNLNVNGIARNRIETMPEQAPYVILNARAEYWVTKNLGVFVNGRNLTNQAYLTPTELLVGGDPNRHLAVPNRQLMVLGGVSGRL